MKNIFLSIILLPLAATMAAGQSIWNPGHLEKVKASLDNPAYATSLKALRADADKALNAKPLSVTTKEVTPASGDKHDYMSLARYFWPDPTKPDGLPYINRDGESNPELNKYDRNKVSATADRVTTLSLAWFFTGEEKYAKKATELLRVWFLDKETKMNPNLEYAQMIPGRNGGKGRNYGVLDTYSFVEMLDAVALLESSRSFTRKDSKALRAWFGELLDWILNSRQGKDEANVANNHGTAYDAQVIALAMYAGREDIARETILAFPERRAFMQIEPDGSQPHELRRTLSYHYSHYNLTHYIDIYLMAQKLGIDIDKKMSEDGRNFYKALDFLVPYIAEDGAERWPYRQLDGFDDVSQKLCKDLYRTAVFLDPSRTDYLKVFEDHGKVAVNDRFNLLYMVR